MIRKDFTLGIQTPTATKEDNKSMPHNQNIEAFSMKTKVYVRLFNSNDNGAMTWLITSEFNKNHPFFIHVFMQVFSDDAMKMYPTNVTCMDPAYEVPKSTLFNIV